MLPTSKRFPPCPPTGPVPASANGVSPACGEPLTGDSRGKTLTFHHGATSGEEAAPYLLIIEGTSSWTRDLPRDGVVVVGRGQQCDLKVAATSLSRRHAKFIVAKGEVNVYDLDSHNGTCVNGERIQGARTLASGDVVTMGEVTFVLRCERPAPPRVVDDRAALHSRLDIEIERALDRGGTFGLLVFSFGEPPSDKADVQERVRNHLERSDLVGWTKPTELVVLLPEHLPEATRAVGQRILKELVLAAVETKGGMATFPADGSDAGTLLSGARAAAEKPPSFDVGQARNACTEYKLGDSKAVVADSNMDVLYRHIGRLAKCDLPVLILGETGTGKEIAALAVHHWSSRMRGRFVPVNCGAIPETLIDNELFGHEPQAFSGATSAKPGLVERAHGGTLFLDELGELSPAAQAKLLRVLETKRVRPVGGLEEREVDFRLVAATNRDPEAAIRDGRFREDLWQRLKTATVTLPPLRDRPREVPILARQFFSDARDERASREAREARAKGEARVEPPKGELSDAVMVRLSTYRWPGNVRELKNAMEFVASLMEGERAELRDLPPDLLRAPDRPSDEPPSEPPPESEGKRRFATLSDEVQQLERRRIEEALQEAGGVQAHAARLLNMPQRTFFHKLKQYNIDAKRFDQRKPRR